MKRYVFAFFVVAATALLFCSRAYSLSGTDDIPGVSGCVEGLTECSDDAYTLRVCVNGNFTNIECMKDKGMLCEKGACVEPWKYGSPVWPKASDESRATKESLAEKAKFYDDIAIRLHVHPELKWIMPAVLKCAPKPCAAGEKGPCEDCSQPVTPQEKATWKDVQQWNPGENDGLFNALYIASQAYRYAVTKDPAALSNLRVLIEGEKQRSEIIGIPGVFVRELIPPGYEGISCPKDDSKYIPDIEKNDNMWMRIGDDGCAWYVDRDTRKWTASKHCGLDKYKGWCIHDNVSKDEYSGHMFALGIVAKLVDDPQIQSLTKQMLSEVADNMMQNKLEFIDWDDRVAEHGRIFAMALDDYPGFNAAMALDYMKIAAVATGEKKYFDFHENCLLQKAGRKNCLRKLNEIPKPYTSYLHLAGTYRGKNGCESNFNNISMHMLSLHNLIWYESDPSLRELYQESMDKDIFRAPDQPRAVIYQNNPFFDFIFAAQKKLGPKSDGPAYKVVENGIRMLRQFPARKNWRDMTCPKDVCIQTCEDRFGSPTGMTAREAADRCYGKFEWWSDPYSFETCKEDKRRIEPPIDYLLTYWMGRYYGFITEDM